MKTLSILSVVAVLSAACLLSGCIAGHAEYADNPAPPPQRIMVKDLSWYEYDNLWFNNGTKPPLWAWVLMPIAGLFY
ncbi:MAG: hypothetical protein ACYC4Q_10415 [Victivallaceae bacterium]